MPRGTLWWTGWELRKRKKRERSEKRGRDVATRLVAKREGAQKDKKKRKRAAVSPRTSSLFMAGWGRWQAP